ncbi:hypothetical protein [Gramella sp. MAR_2010_147]|uniref:hypothetical protein n=1 Tax=Gramella sp. MAR_2010_147 TaxID=1250205 RepID=UPI00087A4E7D|nr:hypothetical protein [Gramella sp. MAR_2010_147]SDR66182.1 hypothetical protein SAMN04488553_0080 [Gramella sp. MAR_2010_147]
MKRAFLLIIAIFISFYSFSQDTIKQHRPVKKFIPLEVYENHFGKTSDTTEFMYKDNDTLVRVPNDFDPFEDQDGVKVEYEPKDSTFLSIYKNIVYNTGKSGTSKERMRYWKDEIKIYFDESVPALHSKELMDFAENISKGIDSLNISRNFIPEKANYHVYYLNREHTTDYEPRIGNSKGGYYISWNGKQQIYDAKLKINTELNKGDKYQIQHLKFHFFKSLGHFKSSEQLKCESYLSACNTSREITPIDLELLSYHYSYDICKGVDLNTFTEQTERFNKQLKEEPNSKIYVIHVE